MQNPYNRYQQSSQKGKVSSNPKKRQRKKTMGAWVKPKVSKPAKKSINMSFITLSFVGLSLSFYIFAYTDDFLDLVNRVDIGLTQGLASQGEQSAAAKPEKEEKIAPLPAGKASSVKVGAEELTMKNTSIYDALKKKRRALEKKERRLARLEEDLHKQKMEIEKQLKEMSEMRRNISSKLDKKVAADQESVKKLVGVYANMKPQNAATIIGNLDEELAIKVLAKMKKQNAAAILNYLEPQKAQALSEKYAGLKK